MSDKQPTDSSVDYKATLNLPDTEFAMKANLAVREVQWLEQWYADDLYGKIRAARAGQPKYILHDGPPYANGSIHLGHAVNKVLKDIIVKSKTLSGYDAPFVPGWDCHGLPIELKVEEKVGKVGEKVDAATFREQCRAYALTQIEGQRQDFKRLGVLGDWDNPYLTMNFKQEADIVRALGAIQKAGHIQPGLKPVNWCMDCGSALAEAEVEYEDKKSDAIDVGFAVVDLAELSKRLGLKVDVATDLVIWTTTPWTLPANQAVALNAEIDYQLIRAKKSFTQPLRIETTRFVLRKIQKSDKEALKKAASDPLIWQLHPVKRNQPELFDVWFQEALSYQHTLVIEDKTSQEVIGSTRFYDTDVEAAAVTLGYTFLTPAYWGAANQEIKAALLDYAFERVQHVWFHIAQQNLRSKKQLKNWVQPLKNQGH